MRICDALDFFRASAWLAQLLDGPSSESWRHCASCRHVDSHSDEELVDVLESHEGDVPLQLPAVILGPVHADAMPLDTYLARTCTSAIAHDIQWFLLCCMFS